MHGAVEQDGVVKRVLANQHGRQVVADDAKGREAAAHRGGLADAGQGVSDAGAGHDAQEMAAICPSAMVFVPGEYDGISHNPREYSTPRQCEDGVNALLDTVLELAG